MIDYTPRPDEEGLETNEARTAFPDGARLFDTIHDALLLQPPSFLADRCMAALDAVGLMGLDLFAVKIMAERLGNTKLNGAPAIAHAIIETVLYKSWEEMGLPDMPEGSRPADLTWELRVGLIQLIAECARTIICDELVSRLASLSDSAEARAAVQAQIESLSVTWGAPPTYEEAYAYLNPAPEPEPEPEPEVQP